MQKSVLRFPSPSVLRTCLFALSYLTFSSVGYASPQPSEADNVHFCLPIDFEEMRESDSLYAARKQAFDLNVGESRTVRLIYFLPNDSPFRAEMVDSMKVAIRRIQTFYSDQMQVHGYGNKTFRFETDAQGEPIIHHVNGQHPDSHYLDNTSQAVNDEIEQVFDRDANIYFIVVDHIIKTLRGGRGGRRGKNAGFALVLVADGKLDDLVARYPLRKSNTLDIIAKALKCQNRRDYEQMVVSRIRKDGDLAQKLKERIAALSCALDAETMVSKNSGS